MHGEKKTTGGGGSPPPNGIRVNKHEFKQPKLHMRDYVDL